MPKPLHKIGDEVYYLTFHGMKTARVIKVYRSSTTAAYDLDTDVLIPVGDTGFSRKIQFSLEEKDLFKPANA